MLSLLKGHVNDAVAPFIFLVLFLVIVGAALWLTPRDWRKWLDKKTALNGNGKSTSRFYRSLVDLLRVME